MSNNEESFDAEFELDKPDPPRLDDEHCKAKRRQIEDVGRTRNEQIRIEFDTPNEGSISAIYTVTVFHNGDAKLVVLGDKIKNLLPHCELSDNKCKGKVKAQIILKGIDNDEQAKTSGELIEHLYHESQNHNLIVIAPHGGEIEEYTDKQAEYVWSQFSSDRASLWTCKGFGRKHHADALERWHITSTEISEKSFPQLNSISGLKFEYSIAFHGWRHDSICVGGSAGNDLIGVVKESIQNALKAQGSDIKVNDPNCPEGCPDGFNGDNDKNIVNRLGTKGIQIEQCKKARECYHKVIAKAVVDAISSRINV